MDLQESIESLPRTKRDTIRVLGSMGIETFWDLLNHFPSRFEDYSHITKIDRVQFGEMVTLRGRILDIRNEMTRRGFGIQKATLADDTGVIELVWYNQKYLVPLLTSAQYVCVAGVIKLFAGKCVMQPQEYELVRSPGDDTIHTGRLVPLYPERRGISSRTIREKMWYVLNLVQSGQASIKEWLPQDLVKRFDLIDEAQSYQEIHFPKDRQRQRIATHRIAFDEIFTIQLSSRLVRREWHKQKVGRALEINDAHKRRLRDFMDALPFELTTAQKRCVREILKDLSREVPMNRLLQGDVGSGKTVVATIGAYLAHLNGFKTLLMAPTEILAQQHFSTLKTTLSHKNSMQALLYTSSSKPTKERLKEADIVVGTHALIQKKSLFDKVGYVVVDEQHKFGVAQRAELEKRGVNPHLLTMTATPIPRTVVLTLYGELDVSILDEMPRGRLKVKTHIVPPQKRADGHRWIASQIKKKKVQAFIVCPLIETSDHETMKQVKAATEEFEHLSSGVFHGLKLGLLHGRLPAAKKKGVMEDFTSGDIDILVSTPVVEVGIDVANATIIVIETPERFGLAQLHQLRGRVGRGNQQSYCFLFCERKSAQQNKRLKIFTRTFDGFALAQHDLKIRGAGEIYGTRQHGIADLKVASLGDTHLIEKTSRATDYFLKHYPHLNEWPMLEDRLKRHRAREIARN